MNGCGPDHSRVLRDPQPLPSKEGESSPLPFSEGPSSPLPPSEGPSSPLPFREGSGVGLPFREGSGLGLPSTPILEVRRVTKHFAVGSIFNVKQVHAVNDISFTVKRGQVLALVGESGSGKTTVLRLVARLIPVTNGEILLDGVNVLESEPRQASLAYRSKVQLIFQDPFASLNVVHTIEHHLARPLVIQKKASGRSQSYPLVLDLLTNVGLKPAAEIARRYPHQLSGGQRQRVAIARALAVDPQLILADEPTSMLDVSIRMDILNLIAELKEKQNIAFIYVTHDLASARYIADEIMVMYAGHMVEGGESEEVMGGALHPYTRLLLSAVPNPHAGLRTGEAEGVRGEVPSLVDPPPGCPFAARCTQAMAECRQSMPGVTILSPIHWIRCHQYGAGEQELER